MDQIELLNEILKLVKPDGLSRPQVESMDENLIDMGLDSLDLFLITVYVGDVYGVEETKLRDLKPETIVINEGAIKRSMTPTMIFDFMGLHKTREPASIEEAVKHIK
jgi:acyl carrier protein